LSFRFLWWPGARRFTKHPDVVATRATFSDGLANLELEVDVVQARRAGVDPEQLARFLDLKVKGWKTSEAPEWA
jgi:hypothetical protein